MTRNVLCGRLSTAVAVLIVCAFPARGQDTAAIVKSPTYDVVSIKPNKSGRNSIRISITPDRLLMTGAPLKVIVQTAYNLKVEEQISGISGATADARFDIEAKVDEETSAMLKKLPSPEKEDQRRLMMQAMLADRFGLKIHHEAKEFPIYALVVAKGGPKFREADPKDTSAKGMGRGGSLNSHNGTLTGQAVEMAGLAGFLGGQLHRVVEDRTGLVGRYDFTLEWTPEDSRTAAAEDSGIASARPSIFTAVQEQLGLKLDSSKGMVDTVVVDAVSMPSEN
ncbi:hypothetical protein BH10ACI4_BH10ACI4_29350 [soil metagenome]